MDSRIKRPRTSREVRHRSPHVAPSSSSWKQHQRRNGLRSKRFSARPVRDWRRKQRASSQHLPRRPCRHPRPTPAIDGLPKPVEKKTKRLAGDLRPRQQQLLAAPANGPLQKYRIHTCRLATIRQRGRLQRGLLPEQSPRRPHQRQLRLTILAA